MYIIISEEIDTKINISSMRVVGDADPYKASPFSDLRPVMIYLEKNARNALYAI